MHRNILIITSSGGGGHLVASEALEKKLAAEDPNATITVRNVLKDWVRDFVTRHTVRGWNRALEMGKPRFVKFLTTLQPLADFIFWPRIFLRCFNTLIKYEITEVISTQPVGISAIVWAIRWAQWIKKQPISMTLVITELPTQYFTPFFTAVRNLSKRSRKLVQISAEKPLLKSGETEKAFWWKHCQVGLDQLSSLKPPLRKAFYQSCENRILTVKIDAESAHRCLSHRPIHYVEQEGTLQLHLDEQTRLITIMLGSHPPKKALLNYVKALCDAESKEHHFIVALCVAQSKHLDLMEFIEKLESKSPKVTFLPLPLQGDEEIAPLLALSERTITRSGGMTSMELLHVSQGKIWIHSEEDSRAKIAYGMPPWERGNALYLQEVKGAQFITPKLLQNQRL